jgi:hypothetical protein
MCVWKSDSAKQNKRRKEKKGKGKVREREKALLIEKKELK